MNDVNLPAPAAMQVQQIVDQLDGYRVGKQWMVRCPAHQDRTPSLAITVDSHRILVHCHAWCSQRSVIAALVNRGLWHSTAPEPRISAIYSYNDEAGASLFEVCRIEPGRNGRAKEFLQRYRDQTAGRYVWRKHPRQVLYRLDEVLRSRTVFVVEGEKDVETLRAQGFIATTNAGGAVAPWLPEYTTCLRGKEIILIPDNDPPGRRRAARIARALVGQVKLILLDLEGGAKDVTEWFEQGHSELELINLIDAEVVAA